MEWLIGAAAVPAVLCTLTCFGGAAAGVLALRRRRVPDPATT